MDRHIGCPVRWNHIRSWSFNSNVEMDVGIMTGAPARKFPVGPSSKEQLPSHSSTKSVAPTTPSSNGMAALPRGWQALCDVVLAGGPAFELPGGRALAVFEGRRVSQSMLSGPGRYGSNSVGISHRTRSYSRANPSDARLISFSADSCACSGAFRPSSSNSTR